MPEFVPSPDLDPAVAAAIRDAMDVLRAEFGDGAAPARAGADQLEALESAVASLDAATTQADLLARLIEGGGGFAERVVFFVSEGDHLNGWAAYGFPDGEVPVNEVSLEPPSGSPWEDAVASHRSQDLGANDCEQLCEMLGADPATDGLVVPFVLRGQVAGALYADRTSENSALDRPALRILSYIGAQTLETIPLRQQGATAAPAAPPVEQPRVEEPEEDTSTAEIEEVATVEEPEVLPEASGFEIVDESPGPVADDLYAEAPADEPVEPVAVEEDEDTLVEPELVTDSSAYEPIETVPELPDAEVPSTETSVSDSDVEATLEERFQEVPAAEDTVETDDLVSLKRGVSGTEAFDDEPETRDEDDEFVEMVEDATAPEPAATTPFATREMSTEDIAPPPIPTVEETEEETDPKFSSTGFADGGVEVAPPSDLQGPGWAFNERETEDDTRHEKARRLARLLVTEIKLYNEEKVREGRENGNLYDQLRDDIDRSQRIYEERVESDVRAQSSYFQDELVRILAGGDSTVLGE